MELTIKERFRLMDIMPAEGDILTLKAVRELRESLIPTEEEEEYYDIQQVGTMMYWNDQKEPRAVDIEMSKRAVKVITDLLVERNNAKTLPFDLIDLYEKLVEAEEE